MKIEVHKLQMGLITEGSDVIKRHLYYDLHTLVYGAPPGMKWQPVKPGGTLRALTATHIDLVHMAQELRRLGWCAYYWRDRYGVDDVSDYNTYMNYGRREGLIFGQYCPNLTAWLLANT